MTCCFVCGCEKAKWPVYSKPNASRGPFFPFLDQHRPQIDTEGSNDGRCTLCNVCYAFLIQQWNSFEENGTPLSKRLYWMRWSREDESNLFGNNAYGRSENDYETQSLENNFSLEEESNPASLQESISNGSDDEHSCKQTSKPHRFAPQRWVEDRDKKSQSIIEQDSGRESMVNGTNCFICRHPKGIEELRRVHTKPQMKKETPFFPSLVNINKDQKHNIDSKGCVLACSDCHDRLTFQWQLFTQRNIPFVDRKYIFDRDKELEIKIACFVCGRHDELIANEISCCRRGRDDPYFPFLKNLRKPPGAHSINSKGIAKCCNSCTTQIFKKWLEYESAKTPIHDQLYLVMGKMDVSSTADAVPVPDEKYIVCFICKRREARKFMKEVYSNPYANMDLSFLDKMHTVPGSYFVRHLGQVLICLLCHQSLVYQWQQFDSKNVPLDQREYKLQRYHIEEHSKFCEICKTPMELSESYDMYIHPKQGDENHPFFPCLARYMLDKSGERLKMRACSFCSQNLILQWEHYERDCNTDDDRYRRNYKPHHFVCFLCNTSAHRSNMTSIHQSSCLPLRNFARHQRPLLSVEVNSIVMVCGHCKEVLDDVRSNGASDAQVLSESGQRRKIKKEVLLSFLHFMEIVFFDHSRAVLLCYFV